MNQMMADQDAYANRIAQDTLHCMGHAGVDGERPASHKSAKIPDPPLLTDGKEP